MRLLRMRRCASAMCVAAALMAGCGAHVAAGGAGAALPAAPRAHSTFAHFAHAGSWFRHGSSSGGDLVYMVEGETIGDYLRTIGIWRYPKGAHTMKQLKVKGAFYGLSAVVVSVAPSSAAKRR